MAVLSSGDELAAIVSEYHRRIDAGSEEPLVIELAAGRYERASFGPFDLVLRAATPARPRFDVVIRGPADGDPAVLAGPALVVHARNVTLDNLVIGPRRGQAHSIELQVQKGAELRHLTVVGHRLDRSWGSTLIRAITTAPGVGGPLRVLGCTFADDSASTLLEVLAAPGAGWSNVDIAECTFAGNPAEVAIRTEAVDALTVRRCAVATDGTFLVHAPAVQARIVESVLVVPHADAAVRCLDDADAAIVQCTIAVTGSQVGRREPRLERSRIVAIHPDEVAAWTAAVIAEPRGAHRAALVALLDEVVG